MQYDFEQEKKRNAEIAEEQRDQKDTSLTEKKDPIVEHAGALFDAAATNPEVSEEAKTSLRYHLATISLLAEKEKNNRTKSANEITELKGWINREKILPRFHELKVMFGKKDSETIDMILNELEIEAQSLTVKAKHFLAEDDKVQAEGCKKAAKLLRGKTRKTIQTFVSANK